MGGNPGHVELDSNPKFRRRCEGVRLDAVDEELEVGELPTPFDFAVGLVPASIEGVEPQGKFCGATHQEFSSAPRLSREALRGAHSRKSGGVSLGREGGLFGSDSPAHPPRKKGEPPSRDLPFYPYPGPLDTTVFGGAR